MRLRDIVIMHTDDNANGEKFSPPAKVSQDNWYAASCPDAGLGMVFDSKGDYILHGLLEVELHETD